MDEDNLKKLRNEINNIDNQLLQLIIQRTSVVEKIGLTKKDTQKIVDKKRESQVLSRLLGLHKGNFSKDSLVRIWREIFYTSTNVQLEKK